MTPQAVRRLLRHAVAALAAATGLAVIFSYACGGLASLSYDSFRYLAGADSILRTGRYTDINGVPQQTWPPGTSLLYAALSRASGVPPEHLVRLVGCTAFLLTAAATWLLISSAVTRTWLAIPAYCAIVLNTFFLSMHVKLWSDPIALALLTAALGATAAAGWSASRSRVAAWFCAANALVAVAAVFRFAAIAAAGLLLVTGLLLGKRRRLQRALTLLPLATPAPMLAVLTLLGALRQTNRGFEFQPLQLRQNWDAFGDVAMQVIPPRLVGGAPASLLVALLLIALPAAALVSIDRGRQRTAAATCFAWCGIYAAFLVVSQAATRPSFVTDLRILFPLYAAMIAGCAAAADGLLATRKRIPSAIAITVMALTILAGARAARASVSAIRQGESGGLQACIDRTSVVAAISRRIPRPEGNHVLTNVQGLAWYALRVPVGALTREALDAAPAGTAVIYVQPARACADVIEYSSMNAPEIAASPGVSVESDTPEFVFARVVTPRAVGSERR